MSLIKNLRWGVNSKEKLLGFYVCAFQDKRSDRFALEDFHFRRMLAIRKINLERGRKTNKF
jgi:hypothetical protein